MVGDLVVDRVGHSRRKPFRGPVGPDQWAAEDRDLARDWGALGGPARPRDALFISRKTVSVHASHIFDKLGAGNRSEAAAIAHRLGLDVDAPPPPGSVRRDEAG